MDVARISVGEGTFSKNLLNKDFEKNFKINIKFSQRFFTKFFRNKIYENLRNFQSLCENVKHFE